jgi:hypothetical protein
MAIPDAAIDTAAVPPFVKVTVWGGLGVSKVWFGNDRVLGETVRTGNNP